MIISILLVLFTLFIFDFTGYTILKKLNKTYYLFTLPLGFCVFMGIFELFSLIPMITRMNFHRYLMVFLGVFVIAYGFLFIKNLDYFKNFAERIRQRYVLIVVTMATIVGLVMFFLATGYGDSWLFSPMVLSGIDNNAIFSNNGISVNGPIQSFHYTDGYYLFQTILASLAPGDDFTFLLSFFKFIEGFIIVSSLGFIIDYFFKQNRSIIFLVVSICLLVGMPLFTPYPNFDEISTHMYRSMALGTNMLNMVGSSIFVILIISNIPSKYKVWLVPGMALATFAFSSSSLFNTAALLFVMFFVEIYGKKNKDGLMSIVSGLVVLLLFAFVYVNQISVKLSFIFAILGIVGLVVVYFIFKKCSYQLLRKLALVIIAMFLIVNFICLLVLNNTTIILNNIYKLSHNDIYFVSPHYYLNIFGNLVYLILLICAIVAIARRYKIFGIFLLFMILFFANPISYRSIGSVVGLVVYHRLFNLILPGVIAIIGLGAILNYFDDKFSFNNTKYIFAILVPLVFFFPSYQTIFGGFKNFDAYKAQSNDAYELARWDFPKTKNVSTGVLPNPGPDLYADNDMFLRMRGDLNWVKCDASKDFYLVLPKTHPIDSLIEFETQNYNVYYINGGEVCPVSNS